MLLQNPSRLSMTIAVTAIALVVLTVAAVIYIDRLQSLTGEIVAINVTSLRAAEELELTLRDMKSALIQYAESGNPSSLIFLNSLQDDFETWFEAAKKTATTTTEQQTLERLRTGYAELAGGIAGLSEVADEKEARLIASQLSAKCVRQIIPACHEYLEFNEQAITQSAAIHAKITMRLRGVLLTAGLLVPCVGIILGLLIAFRIQRDLAESREQLVRSDQLAAIGRLAAGMAHELRNPLTSILMMVQTSRRGDPTECEIIADEARRMERTIQSYLDFAKPPHPHRVSVNLQETAESVLRLIGARMRHQSIDCALNWEADASWILADPQHMHQLILNLLLNAMDSVGPGGKIGLRIQREKSNVLLLVWDRGPGISSVLLPSIFEPFVSTKEHGTGLGLSICRQIVESHRGVITARNLPDCGAEFQVQFEVYEEPAHANPSDYRRRAEHSPLLPARV